MSCSVGGCDGRVVAKGLCDKHRIRLKVHGSVDANLRPQDWGARTSHPDYKLWHGMVRRCSSPKHKNYVNYGARGIKVCDRWQDFWAFLSDMGPRPSPLHSVDRIDCNGNYEPSNCRWATPKEQSRNRRNGVITAETAEEIKRRSRSGERAGDISRSMSIDYDHVRNVVIGNSWKD